MTAMQRMRYSVASLLLPARRLLTRTVAAPRPRAFRILTFHHVPRRAFPVFVQLIDYIRAQHRLLTPADAERMAIGAGETSVSVGGRVPYLLTFDDGFRSNHEVARAILAPRSIHAVFFVCPALVDAPSDEQRRLTAQYVFDGTVDSGSLDADLEMMSWVEISALSAAGHTIGSHTLSHRRLPTLSKDELMTEIAGSAAILREKLGIPARWFAFPFGTAESMTREAYDVVERTYSVCCSAVRGSNDGSGSPLALFRENVELEAPLTYQKFVCEGGLDFYYASRRRRLLSMLRPR